MIEVFHVKTANDCGFIDNEVFILALMATRGEKPAGQPKLAKLPSAIGAIHPRLSPDGNTIAFSYQGDTWTNPRAGGTMTCGSSRVKRHGDADNCGPIRRKPFIGRAL